MNFWDNIDISNYLKHEKDSQNKLETFSCCPEIVNVSINIYPVCSNDKFQEKVEVTTGDMFAKCMSCGRKMLIQKGVSGFVGEIDVTPVDKEAVDITLTLGPEVLSALFGIDVVATYQSDIEKL